MNIAYMKNNDIASMEAISNYAKGLDFKINVFYQNQDLITTLSPNDVLFVKNIYELGEDPQSIFNVIRHCDSNHIRIYSIEDDHCFDSTQSKDLSILIKLYTNFCEYRSKKSKEYIQKMKDQGIKLGRKEGSTVKLNKMKRRKDAILKDLKRGMSLNNIYEKYKVSRTTINKLRELEPEINEVLKAREKNK
ncbi:MAG: hypothetical protein WC135_03620 [Bacteroidales bacterium]